MPKETTEPRERSYIGAWERRYKRLRSLIHESYGQVAVPGLVLLRNIGKNEEIEAQASSQAASFAFRTITGNAMNFYSMEDEETGDRLYRAVVLTVPDADALEQLDAETGFRPYSGEPGHG